MAADFLAALFALSAAAAWGSGDFTGGLAARRVGPFHTVLISYSVGLAALVIVALVRLEALPPPADLLWGALAGLSGMIGLGFLLRGFAAGRMGIVAPVSAVLAAAIPVIFAALTQGLPRELRFLGFGLALVSIWLLSRPSASQKVGGRPAGLGMALLAGLGFGGFFTMLGQIGESAVFWPLAAGRLASCALMLAFALSTRRPVIPQPSPLGLLTLAGVLDVGGNLFFLLAVQSGRLDVAAVLGSLYPAVTAGLATLIAGEHLVRLQVIGIAVAVLAIVLITI
jgi:drug/metabolite transporter (DMT)-like permease